MLNIRANSFPKAAKDRGRDDTDVDYLDADEDHSRPWHTLSPDEAAFRLNVDPLTGLAGGDAHARSLVCGPNLAPRRRAASRRHLLRDRFKDIYLLLLLFAAALAGWAGDLGQGAIILSAALSGALLNFYLAYRAEQGLAALARRAAPCATVRRDGARRMIAAHALVPGDIVLLEAGDLVPADGRLLAAHGLAIDESALTGRSAPIDKQAEPLHVMCLPAAERCNMAFMQTVVVRGRAEMLVTATGGKAEIARQAAPAGETDTPLQIRMQRLGKRTGAAGLGLLGVMFILGVLRGSKPAVLVMHAVALSIAALPLALPQLAGIALAFGILQMARRGIVARRPAVIEKLAATSVICCDKTKSLTLNQMTVRVLFCQGQRFIVSGEGYQSGGAIRPERPDAPAPDLRPLLVALAACNDSRIQDGKILGDPMEAALLVAAAKGGTSCDATAAWLPRIAEIPFDPAHKYMATFHLEGIRIRVFVKGAPDVLLPRCSRFLSAMGKLPLNAELREKIAAEYRALAERGLQGLLIASRSLPEPEFEDDTDLSVHVADLTFVGLVGLIDPPRPEAKEAIGQCASAGIGLKMFTGDHRDTAVAVAGELGIGGVAITGAELDCLTLAGLAERIDEIGVFARVGPQHKLRIVQALQAKGHVVAMAGDSVGDTAALHRADIGMAPCAAGTRAGMDLELADERFATIAAAVRQARALYGNLRKFIRFQLAAVAGVVLAVMITMAAGPPGPFSAIQLLWLELIIAGPLAILLAIGLAGAAGRSGAAQRRRRKERP